MKVIGLIGGMSWESTAEYYRILNREVRRRLGGQHSARILLYSVDFDPMHRLQHEGHWEAIGEALAEAGGRLERGGADLVLLCTNTMHRMAETLQGALRIPLVHIADATGDGIRQAGLSRVGLLGTRFTMEQDFYRDRLRSHHGVETLVPGEAARERVHRIIYDELVLERIQDTSREDVLGIVEELREAGAQGVVLGCTELPLLVRPEHTSLPLLDTTALHARRGVDLALAEDEGPVAA